MPVNLLLILGAPSAIIVSQRLPGPWLVALGAGFLLVALVVISRAAAREYESDGLVGLREWRRITTVSAYAVTLAIGALALFVSIAWVAASIVLLVIAAIRGVLWWPPLLRTSRVAIKVMIERDPEIVFRFFSDSRNTPSWHDGYESVDKLTAGPVGPGTRFLAHIKIPPSLGPRWISPPTDGIEEIVDYEPYRRYTVRVVSSFSSDPNLGVITIEPVSGGSLVAYTFVLEHGYSVAVSGGILQGLRYDESLRSHRTARWARAKEVLESGIEPTA